MTFLLILLLNPQVSGLSTWVAELMSPLGNLPVLAIVTIACLIVTSITEVASNPATITIFLPILAPLVCYARTNRNVFLYITWKCSMVFSIHVNITEYYLYVIIRLKPLMSTLCTCWYQQLLACHSPSCFLFPILQMLLSLHTGM